MKQRTFYSNPLTYLNQLLGNWKTRLIVPLLVISFISNAQVTPANCVQGCTSNDVQIQRAYLSDQAGNILPNNFVCPVSGVASVYLTLELTTKTPRVGVTIYTKIKTFTPPSTIGNEVSGSPISQCFGIALNQPTNKVTFQQPFSWTCGTAIVMTDIFIGWGTGNSNFCTGTAFQCPATPSKCYSLPPGQFVAIETPVSQNASSTQCSAAPGGTTATFNLNNISVTTSQNVTITWWDDYTAPATFGNQINNPAAYSTATNTVYAKITSNADATVFSVSTVTLTVNQTPNLVINTPAAVCSPNTVDLTAAAVTAGSTIPANTTLSYWTNSDGTGAVPNPAAVGGGTYYIKATCNTTPVCSDIKSVVVTVNLTPANPAANVTQPTCANANGTVTVTSPLDGGGVDYEYNNNGGAYQDGLSFTVPAGGAYSIRARNKNGLCVSTGGVSGTMGAQPQTPANPTANVTQPTCANANGTVTVTSPLDGGGVDYEYSNNGGAYQDGLSFTVAGGGAYSIRARNKNGLCVSTGGASGTLDPQPQTPAKPTLCIVQPSLCGPATGSITVLSPTGTGYEYSKDGGTTWQSQTTFSNLAAGSNPSIIAKKDGCISAAASCSEATTCQAGGSSRTTQTVVATETIVVQESIGIKAYPNPFNDRVKFVVTSPEAGYGSLDVMNMLGQKVKTVFQGQLNAGVQNFELSLPQNRFSTLFYIFRMNGKQLTGKLVQRN